MIPFDARSRDSRAIDSSEEKPLNKDPGPEEDVFQNFPKPRPIR
jgi:hypothetical protein